MRITSIRPSYYFPRAVVIRTACGHFHLRPAILVTVAEGDNWKCYCEQDAEIAHERHEKETVAEAELSRLREGRGWQHALELVEQEARRRADDAKPETPKEHSRVFTLGKQNALRLFADFCRQQREPERLLRRVE